MTTFRLPDLGEGLQDAEIVSWHVSTGDRVVADQPLVSVETAKAVVEIPSPQSGVIAELHGAPGDVVPIGAPMVEFDIADVAAEGAIVGELPGTAAAVKAVPAVRARATKLGIDLAGLTGTGPGGVITMTDVEAAAAGRPGEKTVEKVRGVRRAMAENMARAGAEVVAASVTDDADVDHWGDDTDPTLRLIRAVQAACAAEPSLNAWFDGQAQERRLHGHLDLGIAMDTPDGLFVPVLRDVTARDDADLRRGLDAMKKDVAARRVPVEELRGQTFTLSNFGMFGGRHVALVVVPPQVAIVGAGRIDERVRAVDGKPAVRWVLPLSLTFDHRVVTGGEASRFMATLVDALEH